MCCMYFLFEDCLCLWRVRGDCVGKCVCCVSLFLVGGLCVFVYILCEGQTNLLPLPPSWFSDTAARNTTLCESSPQGRAAQDHKGA